MAGFEEYDPKKHGVAVAAPPDEGVGGGFETYDPKKHGEASAEAPPFDWARYAATRATNTASNVLSGGRSYADLKKDVITGIAKQFGISEKLAQEVANASNAVDPLTAVSRFMPTQQQITDFIKEKTGLVAQNAPESWGIGGKIVDQAVEAAPLAVLGPANSVRQVAGNVARNVLPTVGSVAGGEVAGEAVKGTPLEKYETLIRLGGGLLGGVGTGAAQNTAGNVATGVRNVFRGDAVAESQAQKILARALERDKTTLPALIEKQGEFLPGTPLVAAAGPNVIGATRSAATTPGPARETIDTAAKTFREGANKRIDPFLDEVSTLPPTDVRAAALRAEGADKAPPIYVQAGVPHDPQTILTTKPGTPVPTPSALLGPDGKPLITMKPGPDVVTKTTNSPLLTGADLAKHMEDSGYIQTAIKQAQKLSNFKDLPTNSMAMIDKVYKNLVGLESEARGTKLVSGNPERVRDIGNERRKLANLIEKENPTYGKALKAYADPASLADAGELGLKLAGANMSPQMFGDVYRKLSPAQQKEFMGGVATFMRGKVGGTDRSTPADRFWNNPNFRDKMAQLPTQAETSSVYADLHLPMTREQQAARVMGKFTGGSPTGERIAEVADTGAQIGGLLGDVVQKGTRHALVDRAMNWVGAKYGLLSEGRTQKVNEALAKITTETDPDKLRAINDAVEKARVAAARTEEARRRAIQVGVGGGLLGL